MRLPRIPTRAVVLAIAAAVGVAAACAGDDASRGGDADSAAVPAPAADSVPRAPDATSGSMTLDPRGGGGIRIGMSQRELRRALALADTTPVAASACRYLEAAGLPAGLFFMLVQDTLVRIDVRDSSVTTTDGARVGDSESRVTQLYGARARTTPHKYTGPTGHYVTVQAPGDTLHRIVFETDGQRVTTWRVGRIPEVEWVEGCS